MAPGGFDGNGERGETLLEMLITLILLGVGVVGILAGLVTVSNLAARSAQTTHVRNTAQSYAEAIKQPVDAFEYVPCATAPTATSPGTYPAIPTDLLPDGYEAEIIAIHWVGNLPTGGPSSAANFTTTQPAACPASDNGLQRIVVEVTIDTGGSERKETVTVIKRDARCSGTYQNVDQGPC